MSISTVTSEALQLKLRQLLPSQQGFGTDLSASDTIIPIIDLTEAAEGSGVPENLQTAIAFGSQTVFKAENSTATIANTAGFYRIIGAVLMKNRSAGSNEASITITDGSTTKSVWQMEFGGDSDPLSAALQLDLIVFLTTGETVSAVSNNGAVRMAGSSRQIATSNGTLVQPAGFTPQ